MGRDVQEVKAAGAKLQQDIYTLISQFEETYGLFVERVDTNSEYFFMPQAGGNIRRTRDVVVDVKIF